MKHLSEVNRTYALTSTFEKHQLKVLMTFCRTPTQQEGRWSRFPLPLYKLPSSYISARVANSLDMTSKHGGQNTLPNL